MKKLALFFCLIISTFIITACGTPSTEEVFKKVNEAHKKVDSVEVKFSEHSINQDDKVTGTQKFDFKNNMIYITNDKTNEIYYKDKDDFIISSDDSVEKIEDDSKYVFEIKLEKQQKERKNMLQYLQQFDKKIFEKFELEEKNNLYIFTYKGDKKDAAALLEKMSNQYFEKMSEYTGKQIVLDNIEVDNFDVIITIDKKTNLIQKYEEKLTSKQTVNGRTSNYNMANTFEYVQYNKVKIEKPKVDDEKKEEVTWSKEEKELYEQEAANYLDALIQATVYQNVDGYVEKVPGSQSIEEKQKDGEFQKNLFIGIYIENTKRNIPGADDQQIEALANAFMNALKNTRYKVIGSKADKDHFFKVTLEIEGIDQAKLNHEVQMTLMDEMSKGSITQQDLSKRDFELQIEKYNGEIERLKPITISVDVIRNGNGSYMVLMQDQYLLTFVQS